MKKMFILIQHKIKSAVPLYLYLLIQTLLIFVLIFVVRRNDSYQSFMDEVAGYSIMLLIALLLSFFLAVFFMFVWLMSLFLLLCVAIYLEPESESIARLIEKQIKFGFWFFGEKLIT